MLPFIDLQAQQARIKQGVDEAIQRVLAHGGYIMGPEVGELEEQLAQYTGSKHCIAMSSGTDALIAGLMALDVGPGDAIITTPFTFFATIESIMLCGATPIFADIEPDSFNISPEQIRAQIEFIQQHTDLTPRGIIPVDLYGLPADYEQINSIADQFGLFVLQDAAQSFGATRFGSHAPSHALLGTTSFFPAKPLGCYGDGGAVFTDDDRIAEALRSIRVHGKGEDKYDNVRVGLNARIDTLQAAILLEKLKIYPDEFESRQRHAAQYGLRLDALSADGQAIRQLIPEGAQSAWAQFVIRSDRRDSLSEALRESGIPTTVYYRTPSHQLKACRDLPSQGSFPRAEAAAREVLALPFHPYLTTEQINSICDAIESHLTEPAVSEQLASDAN